MSRNGAAPVRVLFIAGTGRSGTTILSNILGQVSGCFSGGELRYTWERGVVQDHRCGCGKPFSQCPLWTKVMAEAFAPGTAPDAFALAERLDRRMRVRQVPLMMIRRMFRQPTLGRNLGDDTDIVRVYQALARVSGSAVIVDSSKLPPYGMLIDELPGIAVSVVHVVRDPRATAYSWRRKKLTRDTEDSATMPQLESWRSGVLWTLWNLLVEAWWPLTAHNRITVRYEDLVAEPALTVARILQVVDLGLPEHLISGRSVTIAPTHSVAGNPNRHDTGTVELKPDNEWLASMRLWERFIVTALTLPGLHRFGYIVGNRQRSYSKAALR